MTENAERRLEAVAALVNAIVVLVLPPALLLIGMTVFPGNPTGTTVHADGSFAARGARFAFELALLEVPLVPFAVLAGWRTWVHARAFLDGRGVGWRGVVEGGAAGLGAALLVLLPATIARPAQAPAYLIAYGGIALIVGAAFALVLVVTADIVIWLFGARLNAPVT